MYKRLIIPAMLAVTSLIALLASALSAAAMPPPPEPVPVSGPSTVVLHQGTPLWVYVVVALAAAVVTLACVWGVTWLRIHSRHAPAIA